MPPLATVSGALDPAIVTGAASAGDHLIAALPSAPNERASDVFFFEAPLTLDRLGDAMLGRANREDATLTAQTAAAELADFRAAGGALLVELTRREHGGDTEALARLAAANGVQIVAAAHAGEGELAPRLGPGRAGVIVLGPGAGEEAEAEAVALVAGEGVPLMLDAAWSGELLERALGAGVDPGRIAVLGVRALARDLPALTRLAERGVYLHFSGVGRIPSVYTEVSDHDVASALAALVAAGHGERLLLATGLDRRHALRAFGGHGVGFIPRQFLPYLGLVGVEADAAELLASRNLVRFLEWSRP